MERRIFKTYPSHALDKIKELMDEGWTIVASANTSTPPTEPDAHGVSYGGQSFEILAERKEVDPVLKEIYPLGMPKPMTPSEWNNINKKR